MVIFADAPARAQVGQSVYIGGDSVMLGTKSQQEAALRDWSVQFEAVVGLRTDQFVSRIEDLKAEGYRFPPVVVVHLGNNEWDPRRFRRGIDDVQRLLPDSTVFWLNLREWSPKMRDMNGSLAAASARWPNMELLDWRTVAERVPNATGKDNVHLTPAGARAMADLVARALHSWAGTDWSACSADTTPGGVASSAAGTGYWLLDSHGGVHGFNAPALGDLSAVGSGHRAVALRATSTGNGYWVVDDHGGVYPFGDARWYGDLRDRPLNSPITGMEIAPGSNGYWLVAADGGVFSFGSQFHGSTGDMALRAPVRAMASAPDGGGYWLVASDGGVFSFDQPFYGSMGGQPLAAPVLSLAARLGASAPEGYWLYGRDGGVFAFDAPYFGSIPGMGYCNPPRTVALRSTLTGNGYWIVTNTGRVFAFGDAQWYGDDPALGDAQVIDLAVRR